MFTGSSRLADCDWGGLRACFVYVRDELIQAGLASRFGSRSEGGRVVLGGVSDGPASQCDDGTNTMVRGRLR